VDRKYNHRGYRDAEKQEKKDRSHDRKPPQGGPRADQFGPRTPRMVGTVTRARCSNCGAVLSGGFDPTVSVQVRFRVAQLQTVPLLDSGAN